jgi:protein KTI12
MPLVVVCGQPCSGKSEVSAKLAASFRALGLQAVVIDEASLHLRRDAAYRSGSSRVSGQIA